MITEEGEALNLYSHIHVYESTYSIQVPFYSPHFEYS